MKNLICHKPELIPFVGKYIKIIYLFIFIIDGPKVTVADDGHFNVIKEKSAEMPFLFSLPEV